MRYVARTVLAGLTISGLLTQVRSAEVPELIVDGLRHPCAVAVQPNTSHVFVAEGSQANASENGAGRVVRVVDGQLQEVLVGLPLGTRELTVPVAGGPMDLAFLNAETLALVGAGRVDGAARLYVSPVPAIGAEPLSADAALKLPVAEEGPGGPFRLHGLTTNGSDLFFGVQTADGTGGIGRISIQDSSQLTLPASYQSYQRMTPPREDVSRECPVSLAIAPRGEIVAGLRCRRNETTDRQIAFYRSTDGKRLLQLSTGLSELTALAYGPRKNASTGPYLYALDGARASDNGGGLYRLDAAFAEGTMQIQATRIAQLDKPSDMAFSSEGSLYVTVSGRSQPNSDQPAGKLLRFPPGF